MDTHVTANWVVSLACNQRCPYCTIPARDKKDRGGLEPDLEAAVRAFDATGLRWSLHITGGEPLLLPGFIDACVSLTVNHRVSINTNLSRSVDALCDRVDPQRVDFINCSLHSTQRGGRDLDALVQRVLLLKRHGFNTFVTQVMWPPDLDGFAELSSRLLDRGIVVRPKVFRGRYRGRFFPAAYSASQRAGILSCINEAASLDRDATTEGMLIDPLMDRAFIHGDISFTGQLCSAGLDFVHIDHEGTVQRCPSEAPLLGNIYGEGVRLLDAPMRCRSGSCSCPYFGLHFCSSSPRLVKRTAFHYARLLVELPLRKLGLKQTAKRAWMTIKQRRRSQLGDP